MLYVRDDSTRSTRLVGHGGQEALDDLADQFKQVELGLDVLPEEEVLAHVREEGLLDARGRHEELGSFFDDRHLREELLDGEADDGQHGRAPMCELLLEHALSSFWCALVG